MKNAFIIINKKYIISFILICLILFLIIFSTTVYTKSKVYFYTIVIDAGHGGRDVNIRHKVF